MFHDQSWRRFEEAEPDGQPDSDAASVPIAIDLEPLKADDEALEWAMDIDFPIVLEGAIRDWLSDVETPSEESSGTLLAPNENSLTDHDMSQVLSRYI